MSVQDRIRELVEGHDVILFMKGSRLRPQCGFSATVVDILDDYLPDYATVDVLSDPEVRQGVKEFSAWPTIPQLYVKGEFVGGCDIVKEMQTSGELDGVLGVSASEVAPPDVSITDKALAALREFHEGDAPLVVRLEIDRMWQYGMDFDGERPNDVVVQGPGLTLVLDRKSARRANGVTIDFVERAGGGGFKIDNPNEPPRVKQLDPAELRAWMEAGKPMEIFDVRTPQERATASIEGTRLLDDGGRELLGELDRDTVLVFQCHSGRRSQAAAEHALRMGFTQVYNLRGGIDAWSQEVDPSVPRY